MNTPGGIHHLALQVRDLEGARAFYGGLLGLPELRRWPLPDGGVRSVWLDLGAGAFLALERAGAAAPLPGEAPFHFAGAGWLLVALRIEAGARASWERRLADAGVEVVHRTAFTLYVRDPEGNRVGLSHYPEPAP